MERQVIPDLSKVYDWSAVPLGITYTNGNDGVEYIFVKVEEGDAIGKYAAVYVDEDFVATEATASTEYANAVSDKDINAFEADQYAWIIKNGVTNVSLFGAASTESFEGVPLLVMDRDDTYGSGGQNSGKVASMFTQRRLTGTGSLAETGVLTGTDTVFLTQLAIGDVIQVETDGSDYTVVVVDIASNTSATCAGTLPAGS